MKTWGHVVSLSMMVMLSGCASSYSDSGTFIPSPKDVGNMLFSKQETPQELIAKSQDKELTKIFAEGKFSKVTSINALPYGLLLECKRLYETDSFIYLSKSRQFYRNLASDFLQDDIAKAYIDTIQKRGNSYSIYNGEGNQALLKAYVGGSLKENTKTEIYMYDSDFAIVEYNKAGEKVSALIRQARIEPSQLGSAMGHNDPAVSIHQNIFVLFAGELQKIALNLNNATLQNSNTLQEDFFKYIDMKKYQYLQFLINGNYGVYYECEIESPELASIQERLFNKSTLAIPLELFFFQSKMYVYFYILKTKKYKIINASSIKSIKIIKESYSQPQTKEVINTNINIFSRP